MTCFTIFEPHLQERSTDAVVNAEPQYEGTSSDKVDANVFSSFTIPAFEGAGEQSLRRREL